jgi:hypothetical protein
VKDHPESHTQAQQEARTSLPAAHSLSPATTSAPSFQFQDRRASTQQQRSTMAIIQRQPQTNAGDPTAVIQRVQDNRDSHLDYLEEKVPQKNPKTNKDYGIAVACAMLLDLHQFKWQDQDERPDLLNALIKKWKLPTNRDPSYYHKILRDYIASISGQVQNTIRWGAPVAKKGYQMGNEVDAHFVNHNSPQGNPTAGKVPWMQKLSYRSDSGGTLYVMGHLLNADLGGPSLDYNYVPLTGRAGFFGANGANRVHSEWIEQVVKDKVTLLPRGDVTQVSYKVTANYTRGKRSTQINALQNARDEMDQIETAMSKKGKSVSKGQLARLKQDVKDLLKKEIEKSTNLQSALKAVTSGKYWNRTWATLKSLMDENIDLWKLEDAIVPQSLSVGAKWVHDAITSDARLTIPIDLPTAINAPYSGTSSSSLGQEDPVKPGRQYRDFLKKHLDEDNEDEARISAFIMDKQIYEIDQIAGVMDQIARIPDIEKRLKEAEEITDPVEKEATKERLQDEIDTIRSVAAYYGEQIEGFGWILRNDHYLGILSRVTLNKKEDEPLDYQSIWGMFSFGLDLLPREESRFDWRGPKTIINGPSSVFAQFAPKGHPEGSSAEGANPWMTMLEQRRAKGGKTVYVRGHMLNRHLGGPGLDYNMVPLTGNAGWYGANNANAIHSAGVEELVKHLYHDLIPSNEDKAGGVKNLTYEVSAIFGDHKRGQTGLILQKFIKFKEAEEGLKQGTKDQVDQLDKNALRSEFVRIQRGDLWVEMQKGQKEAMEALVNAFHQAIPEISHQPLDNSLAEKIIQKFGLKPDLPTLINIAFQFLVKPKLGGDQIKVPQAKEMLTLHRFSSNWRTPLNNHPLVLQKIQQDGLLDAIIKASCNTDQYANFSLHQIGGLILQNLNLWQFEDTHVPLHLDTAVNWTQDGSNHARKFKIGNILPTDVRAPYDPREEEIAKLKD